MEITVRIPDQLAEEARAKGIAVEVYVEQILAHQLHDPTERERLKTLVAAVDRIRELRKGNRLAGLGMKDLIHEGHGH